MRRRLLPALLSLLLLLAASACQVRTAVTVDMADDGSGSVEVAVGLDAEAMERVPDLDGDGARAPADLAALVREDDLVAVGWTVSEPEVAGDGTTWLRVTRHFGTPDEAERVLAELTGPNGPLRDLGVERATSFGRTRLAFRGTADLSGGLEAFGDDGLAMALDGEPLGEDAADIETRIGQPLADAVTFEITARLDGDDTTWSPRLGEGPVALAADTTSYDVPVLGLALVAVLSLLALVLVLGVRALRSRRA